jgi:hypothetical protein
MFMGTSSFSVELLLHGNQSLVRVLPYHLRKLSSFALSEIAKKIFFVKQVVGFKVEK